MKLPNPVLLILLLVLPCLGAEPATKPASAFVRKLNTLPKELWPTESEPSTRKQERIKWIVDNMKGIPVAGHVQKVSAEGAKAVNVTILTESEIVWGQLVQFTIQAEIKGIDPKKTISWDKSKVITLSGTPSQYGQSTAWDKKTKTLLASMEITDGALK